MVTILPVSVLSLSEQDRLTEHYKNKYGIDVEPGAKRRVYSINERVEIGRLYDRARACGYSPSRIDRFGRLVYARPVKSAVQKMLEEGLALA